MIVEYNLWLVLLSLFVAVQGAFVGLSFARQLAVRPERYRLLLVASTVSLTTAIWSMHFIGMLAARLPMPINYLVLPTLLSAIIAVFFVGVSIFLAASFRASRPMLWIAAVIMGSGIVAMHFIGMTALHGKAMMHHDPMLVVASWIVGVSASGLAMRYAFTDRGRTPLAWASVSLGLAISGMHYTAMAGMLLHPMVDGGFTDEMSLSPDALAVVVALVAFGLSAVFMLVLLPDHPFIDSVGEFRFTGVSQLDPVAVAGAGVSNPVNASHSEMPTVHRGAATESRANSGSNHGVGGDEERISPRNVPIDGAALSAVLPVRKRGSLHNLPIALVCAVKADAHYTWVFDGQESHFCALSIAEVEASLGPSRFARVHRSHLVAVDRIARFRKFGDGGVVDLELRGAVFAAGQPSADHGGESDFENRRLTSSILRVCCGASLGSLCSIARLKFQN